MKICATENATIRRSGRRISDTRRTRAVFPTQLSAALASANAAGTSTAGKKIIGIAPQRKLPEFAGENFKRWFRRTRGGRARSPSAPNRTSEERRARRSRPTSQSANTRVILWPDTFNNFFHPEIAIAAVEVLEDAGFEIVVPDVDL